MTPLGEQVQVEFAEVGQEPVGVGRGVRDDRVIGPGIADFEPVVDEVGERHGDREQAGLQVFERESLAADQRDHAHRVRPVGPDHGVIGVFVRAEHRMRVMVLTGEQPVHI